MLPLGRMIEEIVRSFQAAQEPVRTYQWHRGRAERNEIAETLYSLNRET
jgi:hypothetical protein